MGDTGFEQSEISPSKQSISKHSGAKSGACGDPFDDELDSIIQAWPSLSPTVRRMMLHLVREADFQ